MPRVEMHMNGLNNGKKGGEDLCEMCFADIFGLWSDDSIDEHESPSRTPSQISTTFHTFFSSFKSSSLLFPIRGLSNNLCHTSGSELPMFFETEFLSFRNVFKPTSTFLILFLDCEEVMVPVLGLPW
ncbi:hypothetical protein OCU04_006474 [Sclerotinia nivalis]|uniref:Uncharacterized protein n=1 Tax=Sclerotinia nivalis TaxID=352851 RepID=A0A9X0AN20_9HELO|nr:hypothetical protein OCU04_006474 [Sclerotinia nivalis]